MKVKVLPLFALAVLTVAVSPETAAAQQENILLNLNVYGHIGGDCLATLARDAQGNLYGTSVAGGLRNGGTVFELTPVKNKWSVKGLYAFVDGVYDGDWPKPGVILDAAGNLYGTTNYGGLYNAGTVFELSRQHDGTWKEKQLYSFGNGSSDGQQPLAGVVFDSAGNLYGTTYVGGQYGLGAVYELTPQSDGTWAETILHEFQSNGTDGYTPLGPVIVDSAGNVYGTTVGGGTGSVGTVFELSPTNEGTWLETILHNFVDNGVDGYFPRSVILDAAGNLYGTTVNGGTYGLYGEGTVFKLTPDANGSWTETILHDFNQAIGDGNGPYWGLIFDKSGNLYGTTEFGGLHGFGTVFEMMPTASGGWTETVLHSFAGPTSDGEYPLGALVLDDNGNLYGTTDEGGTYGFGTVFEIRR